MVPAKDRQSYTLGLAFRPFAWYNPPGFRRLVRAAHKEPIFGRVAELVDALGSGSSVLEDVGVRVPPRPPWRR